MKYIGVILLFVILFFPTTANAAYNCPQWEPMMRKYGLPVKDFSYIAKRESGCRIKAINARFNKKGEVIWTLNKNGSIDRGLFQINSVHESTVRRICKSDLDALLTVDCQFKMAKHLYDNYGLKPWVAVIPSVGTTTTIKTP